MNNIPSCIPAVEDLISANASITESEALTFSPPDLDRYGSELFPYSFMNISRVTTSFFELDFCVFSVLNSIPILPPVIWPSIELAVDVSLGIIVLTI